MMVGIVAHEIGPLRIYRTLPQEVAFLQSGSALRPLLKRTQCWNVDGNRVFCLQLRPGNYWRIEILGYVVSFCVMMRANLSAGMVRSQCGKLTISFD